MSRTGTTIVLRSAGCDSVTGQDAANPLFLSDPSTTTALSCSPGWRTAGPTPRVGGSSLFAVVDLFRTTFHSSIPRRPAGSGRAASLSPAPTRAGPPGCGGGVSPRDMALPEP